MAARRYPEGWGAHHFLVDLAGLAVRRRDGWEVLVGYPIHHPDLGRWDALLDDWETYRWIQFRRQVASAATKAFSMATTAVLTADLTAASVVLTADLMAASVVLTADLMVVMVVLMASVRPMVDSVEVYWALKDVVSADLQMAGWGLVGWGLVGLPMVDWGLVDAIPNWVRWDATVCWHRRHAKYRRRLLPVKYRRRRRNHERKVRSEIPMQKQ